jgi:hypothetical protein
VTGPRAALLLLLATTGCSGLEEGAGGVVAIEVTVPDPATIEVNESLQLSARPLDSDGDSVGTAVVWRSADATATVDASTGVVTGVSPGKARVQATVGSLASAPIEFTVIAPADTIRIVGDSVLAVDQGATISPAMTIRLESLHPVGVVAAWPVIFTIISPDPAAGTPAVTFFDGGVVDTITTASTGEAADSLAVVAGMTPPATVVVEVRAERTRGGAVPGSGQRFTVNFAP